ncbi:hypothetical protein ACFQUU_19385 [Herbaspirillum sp. GCM10030257]
MSLYQYNLDTAKLDGAENNDQWHDTPVHLEELPTGLIEDEV